MKYIPKALPLFSLACAPLIISVSASAFQQRSNNQGGVSPMSFQREDNARENVQFFEPPTFAVTPAKKESPARKKEDVVKSTPLKNAIIAPVPKPVRKEVKQRSRIIKLSTKQAATFGILLALTSGFINGSTLAGIFSKAQASVALTGAWTNSAVNLAGGNTGMFLANTKYVLSYMLGSTIGGLYVPKPVPMQICNPAGVAMGFATSSALLVTAGALATGVGFASPALLCLILAASGIQNSMTSALTANLCRTSHLTGITSDIGTFFGQFLRDNKANLTKLKVFPLLAMSFWIGGFLSFGVTQHFQSRTLMIAAIVPGVLSAVLGAHVLRTRSPKVSSVKLA